MKKITIKTLNIFNEEITLTGYVKVEDLKTNSVMLFEEMNDEDFFIIPQQQLISFELN